MPSSGTSSRKPARNTNSGTGLRYGTFSVFVKGKSQCRGEVSKGNGQYLSKETSDVEDPRRVGVARYFTHRHIKTTEMSDRPLPKMNGAAGPNPGHTPIPSHSTPATMLAGNKVRPITPLKAP